MMMRKRRMRERRESVRSGFRRTDKRKTQKRMRRGHLMFDQQDAFTHIRELLKSNPRGLIISDISRKLGINRNTVARYLDVLLTSGQVEMHEFGSAKVFFHTKHVPLSALINSASEAFIVVDSNLKVVQGNDKLELFSGKKLSKIIGGYLDDIENSILSEDTVISEIKTALKSSSGSITMESNLGARDEFYSIKMIPTAFIDGEPGVTIILEDITSRKKTEKALSDSEYKYRSLFERSLVGFLIVRDNPLRFIYTNKALADIFGYSIDEILSLSSSNAESLIHPEDRDKLNILLKERIAEIEPNNPYVLRGKRKDGSIVWIEAFGSLMIFDGAPAIQISIIDITSSMLTQDELTRSEARLKVLLENAPLDIFTLDKDGKVLFASGSILGKATEDLIGTSIFDFMPSDIHKTSRKILEKVKKDGKSHRYGDFIILAEERKISVEAILAPVDKVLHPASFMMILIDVSLLKKQ
ncbi:MAG: PAS domain S-box protein [Candidatus Thorarchaeota archaeon]